MDSAAVKVMTTSLLNTIHRLDNIVARADNIFTSKIFQTRTERMICVSAICF